MKFEVYFDHIFVKSRGKERMFFSCELENPNKLELLKENLSTISEPGERRKYQIEFALKYGDCRIHYCNSGAVVYNNHEFRFYEQAENIIIDTGSYTGKTFSITPDTPIEGLL